ncbi:MAG TPA: efflux RND transporter periplasmic adaptor subunit, partial [Candidatus Krumholzibacteria bacterium]|nr:efflux RND transporter periplasmic adaptor subunit [Candidatus Krumholzibacteria bacterium]
MSEKTSRKGLVFVALAVALALAGGTLWKLGVLPTGAGAAQADSTVAAADADDAEAKDAPPAVPVELARVERRGIDAYYKAASVLEADRLVDLVTKVQGRVRAVNVEEGDWVERGAIVAELENDREQVQLRAAELKLQEQQRLLDRNRSMVDEGLISDQEFDTQRSAFDVAETERDLARIALEETRIRAPFAGRVTERKVVQGQQVNAATALF